MVEPQTLPEYEELIANLADRLGGLSVVHRGVGDATASLVAAHRELASLQQQLEELLSDGQQTLQEIRQLDPARLESSFRSQLVLMETQAADRGELLIEHFKSLNEQLEAQKPKSQQLGKLVSLIATGETPFQKDLVVAVSELRTRLDETDGQIQKIDKSLAAALADIDGKLNGLRHFQDVFTGRIDELQSTASNNATISNNLSATMAGRFDDLQKEASTGMQRLLRMQIFLAILIIAALISIWLIT